MSFTLRMYKERQLEHVFESLKLSGYFYHIISVHPLASLFETGKDKFGRPTVTGIGDNHIFVEGKIGLTRMLSYLPPLNLLLAQIDLIILLFRLARNTLKRLK